MSFIVEYQITPSSFIFGINVKTEQFKTWSKDDKSNTENCTDTVCEDTRQKALESHVTPFN